MKNWPFRTPEARRNTCDLYTRPAAAPVNFRRFGAAFVATFAALVCFGFLVVPQAMSVSGGTFTVTNVADNTSGNTTAGSLRDGIAAANSGGCAAPCTIVFGVTGNINLFSPLPIIGTGAAGLTIDGFSATGAFKNTAAFGSAINATLPVAVTSTSGAGTAFTIATSNVTIQGLVISGFGTAGVSIGSVSNTVKGCFLGTNTAGTAAFTPAGAVAIQVTGGTGHTIGGTLPEDRNLISGNSTVGVWLSGASANILGNYIGTNAAGTAAITSPSQPIGVRVDQSGTGVGTSAMGNVISGNTAQGVLITAGSGSVVRNNRIGTNAAGTASIPNDTGIYLGGAGVPSGTTIGGSASEGNLISGNTNDGIQVNNAGVSNVISENNIGVNISGTGSLPNNHGIQVLSASTALSITNNRICGGASDGINLGGGASTSITGNQIGVYSTTPIGNTGRGIYVTGVSGTTIIATNTIANNGGNGVDVDGSTGVKIVSNQIGNNGTVGIDLHASALNSGPTANDAGDLDSGGGNSYQNYPTITSATLDGGTTSAMLTAKFNVDSALVTASQSFRVELFEADGSSPNAEGKRPLGSLCYTPNNNATLTMTVGTAGLTSGSKIVGTATAYTDTGCTAVGDGTSEFSQATVVTTQPGLVVNTNDSGSGSLRQAILDANTGACPSPCTIKFAIPTSDPGYNSGNNTFTIAPTSALSALVASNSTIDGTTQLTNIGVNNPSGPEIVLNGASAGTTNGINVGFTVAGTGNNITISNIVVNGFNGYGIAFGGVNPNLVTNSTIIGCYIGTNASGTSAVANSFDGVILQDATGCLVTGNVISGNGGNGIELLNSATTLNSITSNTIGLNATKTAGIANGNAGILLIGGASTNTIGGGSAALGNTIAFNTNAGVAISGSISQQNAIRRNSIYSNGLLGIDLGNDGITSNDSSDPDSGPNQLQNSPVLTTATYNCLAGQTIISGTLNSNSAETFEIDWYSNTAVDPSGHGEGKTYETTSNWITDGSGNATISVSLPGDRRGSIITATATRQTTFETSEFSPPATPANNAPVTSNDTLTTNEDTPGAVNVVTNDSDAECDTLTAGLLTPPSNGGAVCSGTSCTYTPNPNFNGTDSFQYEVSDGTTTTPGNVSVMVTAVNDPPVATNDSVSTLEDNTLTFNVLTNDTDTDGPSLTVSGNTAPANGTATCSPSGGCSYVPNANFNGADSFNYTVTDGTTPATGTVSITVTPVNDAPIFTSGGNVNVSEDSGAYSAAWATGISAGPANETGQSVNFVITANTSSALFSVQPSISPSGILSFTPAANANGLATVTIQLTDNGGVANGGSNAGSPVSFNITVNSVNDAPTAVNDSLTVVEDSSASVNVLTNDTDPENDTLTISGKTNGTNGSVTCSATTCTYSPNLNFTGTDSFTYTITDGSLTSTATVNVNVTPVNDAPVANGDSYSIAGNSTLTVPAPGVLGNDTDVDSAPPFTATQGTGPTHGTLTLNADGSFIYTPTTNYTGPDSFTYTATDAGGAVSASGTVAINVVTAVNAADLAIGITDSPDPVLAGGSVTYTVTISNLGPNTNSPYALTLAVTGGTIASATGGASCSPAPAATSVTCTGSAIAPSSSAVVTLVANAGGGPTVALTGSISYAVDPNTANNTASQTTTVTPSANIAVQKTLSGPLSAGQNATYAINVKNFGPSNATNVTVSDNPPAGLTFVSSSCGSFPCSLGTLTPGQIVTVNATFAVASNATGSLTNTASATATENDPVPTDNSGSATGTVTTGADVSITKSGPASAQPSTNITYTINVFNAGPADATGVAVNDTPPSRLAFVSASGACTSFPCTIGTVAAGANKTISATYAVSPGPNVSATNVANVTSTTTDANTANNSASASTNIGCHSAPTNLSPDAVQNAPTSGTLQWSNAGATSYRVYLGPAGSGCQTLLGTTTSTSMPYSGLTPGAAYEWRVESVSAGCTTASSTCRTFTTAINCNATPPTLIAPLATAPLSSPVAFSWTSVPNATRYHVFVSVGGASSVEIGDTTNTTLTANVGDGTATWFVVADVPGCGSLQSASGTFAVCNGVTPAAGVIAESASGQSYDVSWEPVPGATMYEIDEATNDAFTDAQTKTVTTNTVTYTHTALTNAQPFFYRVRAFTSCRQQFGAYSPVIRVVIAPIPAATNSNHNANVPAGSKRVVVQQVFVPGFPDGSFPFTATVDKPWLTVSPSSGILPPQGITLNVTADPANLPNGTFTGTVLVNITTPNNSASRLGTFANKGLTFPVSVSLVTPVTPQPKTEPFASSLIIPSVGHLNGIGSRWQSDIRVANTTTQKVHYQLTFTPQGDDASKGVKTTTIEVDANGTTALDDIVRNWYGVGSLGETANGVLEIRPLDEPQHLTTGNATSSFTVSTVASSRTYNTTSTGTLGQYIPAIPFGNFIGKQSNPNAAAQVLSLQQIAQSDAYRTNVGVVEASGKPVSLLLSVFASSGAKLLDFPVDLAAGEQKQLNGFLAEHNISIADGRVEVKVTGGDGKVTAYASVIDNHTNDPLLVSGVQLSGAIADHYVLPGVADLNNGLASWRTDARLFNAGTTPQGATLTFYPQNNSGSPVANAITINPGEVRTLDNILQSFFGLGSNGASSNLGGAVHISTPGASNLVVTGRTYNKTSDGTFGQYIPAVTPDEAVGANQRALNILQVEESPRYRTNLGLAEVTGKQAHIEVTVNLPDSKVTPRLEFTMEPNEFRQFSIINELGLGNTYNARITVKVLEGEGKVTAYGSVIDRETQDPTYVPAQ